MFVITPSTSIAAILKNCPQSLEAIIGISPAFNKLRNPLLRKLMAGRITIKDASRIGKCKPENFFEALRPLGMQFEGFNGPENDNKPAYSVFAPQRKKNAEILDVRNDLASGADPLNAIITALNSIEPGRLLCLVNTFEPLPLLRILSKKNFHFEVETTGNGQVLTWIEKEPSVILGNKSGGYMIPRRSFEAHASFFLGRIHFLDVSTLEMPGPMTLILESLEKLPANHALLVHHRKIPLLLFPELHERGFICEGCEFSEQNIQLLIYRAGEMCEREDGSGT